MTTAAPADGARTRKLREPSESIPWRVLQDERISFRALGVLVLLLSLPDNWKTNATALAKKRKEGRDAVETALTELEAAGYLFRRRLQYRGGTWGWLWMYGDDPAYVAVAGQQVMLSMVEELHPSYIAKHLQTGPLSVVPDA